MRNVAHLQDVDDQGEDVAHEKDDHNHHEHCGQPDLPLLEPGQLRPLRVGLPDLEVDPQVEGGQAGERDDVHHHKVHPGDVNAIGEKMQRQMS